MNFGNIIYDQENSCALRVSHINPAIVCREILNRT